jgi:hypothetical protein
LNRCLARQKRSARHRKYPEQPRHLIRERLGIFNVTNNPLFEVDFYQELPLEKVPSGWPNPQVNLPKGAITFNPDGTIMHLPLVSGD